MLFRFAITALIACPFVYAGVKIEFTAAKRDVVAARLAQAPATNAERAAALEKMFQEAGCAGANLRTQHVKGSHQPNVICSIPGETGDTIIMSAHLDFAAQGKGIVEDWSGIALLPSLFEALKTTPRKHSFVFIGFADRQNGQKGANFYVKSLSKDEKAKIKAMIALDSLGLSPTKVQLKGANENLSIKLASIAKAMNIKVTGVDVPQEVSNDTAAFGTIPSITVHSIALGDATPGSDKDTAEAVNMDYYYDTYHLMAAYLVYLDQMLQ
jgi:hypothetical protein